MANQDNFKGKAHRYKGQPPKVVDMATFKRLLAGGNHGILRMARELGCGHPIVIALKKGQHWQQIPDKVRKYNAERGMNVDPETGMPTEKDLITFGYKSGEMAKVPPPVPITVKPMPANLSSATFLEQIETNLWHAMQYLTPETLQKASVRDLSTVIAMLIEKRQLLKGEPTVITRNDQRTDIADFAKRLLGECERRGIKLGDINKPAMITLTAKEVPSDA